MAKRFRDFSAGIAEATQAGAAQADNDQQELQRQLVSPTEPGAVRQHVALDRILPRAHGDLRLLRIAHVCELAISMDAVGLIQPLAVDQHLRLLAGGHRLAALQLLATNPAERRERAQQLAPEGRLSPEAEELLPQVIALPLRREPVPVRVFESLDALTDPATAKAIESAENEKRRGFTPRERLHLQKQLESLGYQFDLGLGRPAAGARSGVRAMATILGCTQRGIRKMLAQQTQPLQARPARDLPLVLRALQRLDLTSLDQVQAALQQRRQALLDTQSQ
jgi:ParB family chromosome partitioning protein